MNELSLFYSQYCFDFVIFNFFRNFEKVLNIGNLILYNV